MEFINRYANETEDQYIKRVCDNKDALNISWTELGNNLNKVLGKDLNPDTYIMGQFSRQKSKIFIMN